MKTILTHPLQWASCRRRLPYVGTLLLCLLHLCKVCAGVPDVSDPCASAGELGVDVTSSQTKNEVETIQQLVLADD